jgi:hypothetical protein
MNRSTAAAVAFVVISALGAHPRPSQAQTAPAPQRPIPYPVVPSRQFSAAVAKGTRTTTGVPGARYWQQYARYRLTARLDVPGKRLEGTAHIQYLNNSPDTLRVLYLQTLQNFHAQEAPRLSAAEITGGLQFTRVAAAGQTVAPAPPRRMVAPGQAAAAPAAYRITGTTMAIRLAQPVLPHDSVALDFEWGFRIPQDGVNGRMGWNGDDLVYLAYWYPQMAVYDDVVGWQTDPFIGMNEFYAGFASYDVTLDVPEGWLVSGTGELVNAAEVLPENVLQRLHAAEASDTVVHVLTAADFGPGRTTRPSSDGRVRWHFAADTVRDVVFAATAASVWDAVRTPVAEPGAAPRYARAEAVYRLNKPQWQLAARDAQHSIAFHSRHTGVPYPYSHATAIEGDGIMGGGMEYPMMTLIGGFDGGSAADMYGVVSHELAHEWVPMIVNTDERRYAWMDEGTTTFNEEQASRDMFPGTRSDSADFDGYLSFARTGDEGEMMRWSDFQYGGMQLGVASYAKPASVLEALRTLLGADTFNRGYQTYLRTWRFRHPLPWDFFAAFNTAAGQDLSWFWRSWYYETWTLDQAVGSVTVTPRGTEIEVRDLGDVPMPARLTIALANGDTLRREVPVATWLAGRRSATVTVPRGRTVVRVEIDALKGFPDIDRKNNVWVQP